MITNSLNLPQPFVDAATSDYRYRPNRYSVTEVLGGTCEAVLKRRHQGEGEEDVSDRVWAILGTAVHKVLESARNESGQHQEQRVSVPIDVEGETYTLSGIFDLYDESTGTVTDWKVTSVYSVMLGDAGKWRDQTLLYCWMLRQQGQDAHRGQIVAILRDHNKRKAAHERDYPPHPVQTLEWEFSHQDFARAERMVSDWMIEVASQGRLTDAELVPCGPDHRWHKGDVWAVTKDGRKRATRLFTSEPEAIEFMDTLDGSYHIEFREGEDTRCKSYCSVSQFCPHAQKVLQDS